MRFTFSFRSYFSRRATHVCLVGLTLALGACASDLVVKNVHYEQFTGPNLVMKATVRNQWIGTAGASTTRLDRTYSWADPFVEMSRMPTPSLRWLQSKELPLWVFPPNSLPEPGSCMYVRVCADTDNVVDELLESNNCRTQSFMNKRYCRACSRCCDRTLPATFDWRSVNGVNWISAVRDQATCGSCWAFSAVAAVEAEDNVQRNQPSSINLSEQQLVSCPGGGGSCQGGWPGSAMAYIQTSGIVGENTLQYTSTNCVNSDNSCKAACTSPTLPGCANPLLTTAQCTALDQPAVPFGSNPPSWRIGGYHYVANTTVDGVKRALLCHGPLSVCGTWYVDSNGDAEGHCVLLVGWDSNGWLFKNSWGTGYGTGGYGSVPFSGHSFSNLIYSAFYVEDVTERP